jgi:hypothetical protein
MEEHVSTRASTKPVSAPVVLLRVIARTGVGLWRHKGTVVFGVGALAVASAFTLLTPTSPLAGMAADRAAGTATDRAGPSGDCADAAMAAIADGSPATVQRAYDCMEPTYQQRVSEEQFASQFAARAQNGAMPVDKLARVADYREQGGGQMVYYALSSGNQSVGYIVYLDPEGKVAKVE